MSEKSQHLSSQFDAELRHLRSHVLQMGGLVEKQLGKVIEILMSGTVEDIQNVVAGDRGVDELEKNIDDDCAHVIAKRQPAASDLRLVLGIIKIVTDLERAGDEAKKIAKGLKRIYSSGYRELPLGAGTRHLADVALAQLRRALDAFARMDNMSAHQVIVADRELDVEFKAIIRQLMTHMMEDPRTIGAAIEILTIARAIERIGDHAKNLSEQVVFIVEGRDIRHSGKGKAAETAAGSV